MTIHRKMPLLKKCPLTSFNNTIFRFKCQAKLIAEYDNIHYFIDFLRLNRYILYEFQRVTELADALFSTSTEISGDIFGC